MIKKITILGALFIIYSLLMSTTCNKHKDYWEIGGVNVTFRGLKNNLYHDSSHPIKEDSVLMMVQIMEQIVNQNRFSLVSEAYAYDPEYLGPSLNHTIKELTITSDKDFNGIEAGKSLNSKIVVLENFHYSIEDSTWIYDDTLSIQDFTYKYLVQFTNYYEIGYEQCFLFKQKPDAKSQVFKFDFVDSQGKHFYGESDTLWME